MGFLEFHFIYVFIWFHGTDLFSQHSLRGLNNIYSKMFVVAGHSLIYIFSDIRQLRS